MQTKFRNNFERRTSLAAYEVDAEFLVRCLPHYASSEVSFQKCDLLWTDVLRQMLNVREATTHRNAKERMLLILTILTES